MLVKSAIRLLGKRRVDILCRAMVLLIKDKKIEQHLLKRARAYREFELEGLEKDLTQYQKLFLEMSSCASAELRSSLTLSDWAEMGLIAPQTYENKTAGIPIEKTGKSNLIKVDFGKKRRK